MNTGLNVFDSAVVEGILRNCKFHKDMTITEVLNEISSNPHEYINTVNYSVHSLVLHIEQSDGIRINISPKQSKIIIAIYNNKGDRSVITHKLDLENKHIGEVHAILLNTFVDLYKKIDLNYMWTIIAKTSDVESIQHVMNVLAKLETDKYFN